MYINAPEIHDKYKGCTSSKRFQGQMRNYFTGGLKTSTLLIKYILVVTNLFLTKPYS